MNIKQSFFVSAIIFTIIPSIALAQTTTPTTRNQMRQENCTVVTNHITNLITRLTNDDTIRQNRHQKVIDRLNIIIAKLQAKNINTDKLTADVATVTQKRTTWYSAYTALLDDLNATKNYACGKSQGQFKQAAHTAQSQRLTMHEANMDFWTFVESTVKPDLQAIRSQLKVTATP